MAAMQAEAAQFGAGAQNQASLANAASRNQFGLAQFGADADRASQLAAAQNQANLTGYQGRLQTNLAQAGMTENARQFNAGSQNQFNLANMAATNDMSQFNAAARNQMSQFNAGQQDNAANRGLAAAGLMGGLANDYGNGTRADLTTMAGLGEQQRAVQQQQQMAELAQLQMMGQLMGMTPYDALVGRQVNGTSNSQGTLNGTEVTRNSPSLFNQLLAAGQIAGSFFMPGG
jgi:hypothetical protein